MKKLIVPLMLCSALTAFAANKKVVLIAGSASHGNGHHEHRARCLLFKTCQTERLCLSCTLCCNGRLFADLRLSAADRARLARKSISLKLNRVGKLLQPCQALCGSKCSIYSSRPGYCRRFECLLLKQVNAGAEDAEAALGIIRKARRRLARVERLLSALGDHDKSVAVSVRFRRLSRIFAATSPAGAKADMFGELTLAIHALNHYLAERFYPRL